MRSTTRPSSKEEGFRYHARDMAMLRAHGTKAVCVLGSATPSVETRYLADEGRWATCACPNEALANAAVGRNRGPRPPQSGPSGSSLLSAPLHRALAACLESGSEAICS
ncbi:MAG: hypothetical protein R3A78_13825 [Polyangiales bacterium]